uniref:Uncharacterized protein n=2 Tax=Arundo donax TaxID=35708 RepID=A0A0A9GBN5_ARUDO
MSQEIGCVILLHLQGLKGSIEASIIDSKQASDSCRGDLQKVMADVGNIHIYLTKTLAGINPVLLCSCRFIRS